MVANTGDLSYLTSEFLLHQGELKAPVGWHFPQPRMWFKPVVTSVTDTPLIQRYRHQGRHRNGAVNRMNVWRDWMVRFAVLSFVVWFYFFAALILKGMDSAMVLFQIETALVAASTSSGVVWRWLRYQEGRHTAHRLDIETSVEEV